MLMTTYCWGQWIFGAVQIRSVSAFTLTLPKKNTSPANQSIICYTSESAFFLMYASQDETKKKKKEKIMTFPQWTYWKMFSVPILASELSIFLIVLPFNCSEFCVKEQKHSIIPNVYLGPGMKLSSGMIN